MYINKNPKYTKIQKSLNPPTHWLSACQNQWFILFLPILTMPQQPRFSDSQILRFSDLSDSSDSSDTLNSQILRATNRTRLSIGNRAPVLDSAKALFYVIMPYIPYIPYHTIPYHTIWDYAHTLFTREVLGRGWHISERGWHIVVPLVVRNAVGTLRFPWCLALSGAVWR